MTATELPCTRRSRSVRSTDGSSEKVHCRCGLAAGCSGCNWVPRCCANQCSKTSGRGRVHVCAGCTPSQPGECTKCAHGLSAAGVLAAQHEIDLTANGACEAVVQALNAHAGHCRIQLQGLSVLVMLTHVGAARLRLVAAGAGAAAVRAMRAFPADSQLQCHALSIILC